MSIKLREDMILTFILYANIVSWISHFRDAQLFSFENFNYKIEKHENTCWHNEPHLSVTQ